MSLCVKIALPGDQLIAERVDYNTEPEDYGIPRYHTGGKQRQVAAKQAERPKLIDENAVEKKADNRREKNAAKALNEIGMDNEVDRYDPDEKEEFEGAIEKDPRYKCKGIRVRFNYAQV